MLHYTEFGISHTEVPSEVALCIYISGCQNRCKECHYPELQRTDYVKIGSYQKDRGALCERTTNQQMWKRMRNGSYEDITHQFWGDD